MAFPQQIYVANTRKMFLGHIAQNNTNINKSCVFGFIKRDDMAKVYKYLYEHGMHYNSQKLKCGNFCIIPKQHQQHQPQSEPRNKPNENDEFKINLVDSQQLTNLLSINNVNLAYINNVNVNIDETNGQEKLVLSTSAEIYNMYDNDTLVEFLNYIISTNVD